MVVKRGSRDVTLGRRGSRISRSALVNDNAYKENNSSPLSPFQYSFKLAKSAYISSRRFSSRKPPSKPQILSQICGQPLQLTPPQSAFTIEMENGNLSQGGGNDPSGFLSEIIGSSVTVKLNSGLVYKGTSCSSSLSVTNLETDNSNRRIGSN